MVILLTYETSEVRTVPNTSSLKNKFSSLLFICFRATQKNDKLLHDKSFPFAIATLLKCMFTARGKGSKGHICPDFMAMCGYLSPCPHLLANRHRTMLMALSS